MRIGDEQIAAQRSAVLDRFLLEQEQRFRAHTPAFAAAFGGALRAAIRFLAERAAGHGLRSRRDLACYLTVGLWLGSFFDEDPQLPWAASILRDGSSPDVRAEALIDRATAFVEEIRGPGGAALAASLGRAHTMLAEAPGEPPSIEQLAALARRVYPERAAAVGEGPLRAMIQRCHDTARPLGLAGGRGLLVHTGLSFFLGSGYTGDPLYPWAREALAGGPERLAAAVLEAERRMAAAMEA